MNNPQDLQNIERLEHSIHAMHWETVQLEPAIEQVQIIDQQLPDAWRAESDGHTMLDISPGDIDDNARQAIKELDLDIHAIFQDIDTRENQLDAPTSEHTDKDIDRDNDFGR